MCVCKNKIGLLLTVFAAIVIISAIVFHTYLSPRSPSETCFRISLSNFIGNVKKKNVNFPYFLCQLFYETSFEYAISCFRTSCDCNKKSFKNSQRATYLSSRAFQFFVTLFCVSNFLWHNYLKKPIHFSYTTNFLHQNHPLSIAESY